MKKTLLVLGLTIFGVQCLQAQNISRPQALEIVRKGLHFPIVETVSLLLGHFALAPEDKPKYMRLAAAKVLTVSSSHPPNDPRIVEDVRLTPKGEEYHVRHGQFSGFEEMRCCERNIIGVTGITGDKQAVRVEYTWEYQNVTPFGSVLGGGRPGEHHQAVAYLRLYDDGWRLVKE